MPFASRSRDSPRTFAVFAVLSAVPVVALGAVLDRTYRDASFEQGMAQCRAQAAVIEEMAVSASLSGDDLTSGLTDRERERLSRATDLAVYKGSVLRLRLRDFDGEVVFSDDGRVDEAVPATSRAFQLAAVGRTTAQLVDTPAGPAALVLRPVVASASGRSTGVLELQLPYAHIAEAVDAQVEQSWHRLLVGLVLLYAVLAGLAWSTSRSLRRLAAQRQHEALHDPLTHLPNRALFQERAEQACAAATERAPVALVLVDLDRFKQVNDTLGHHAGDHLLRTVARRLSEAVRADDTVARLGGDEFGLVLPGVPDEATVVQLLEQVRGHLAQEVLLDGVALSVEASIGVALAPQHGSDVESLLRRADAAMYVGKRGGRSVVVAEPAVARAAPSCLAVHAELRSALERDELVLHYQPRVDLRTGRVPAVEALVRWQHPQRGLLEPEELLTAVETSGLAEAFADRVLGRALADLSAWTAAGLDWSVAVTVPARGLAAPGFAGRVTARLAGHGVPAYRVGLEITGTARPADHEALAASVRELAAAGVGVGVDDVGTGWNSMTQLWGLPVAEVRIDRGVLWSRPAAWPELADRRTAAARTPAPAPSGSGAAVPTACAPVPRVPALGGTS